MPILLTAVVYLASATNRAVTDYDEAYYVQPALHMVESGHWVTPCANGVRFLEKPPLLYWVTAASFKVFGINEFALRLPTALAVIALVWIVMLIVRPLAGEHSASAAGLAAAFSAGTYLFTRETLHDIWLVLFLALSVYAFLKWYLDPMRSLPPALLFYAAVAGAFMCKSLIGAAFPVGVAVVFLLLSREWPGWKSLHLLPGAGLFLLLTVPWHWLAALENRGFLEFFFIGEQFLRFLGRREPPVLWSVPLWLFWVLVLVWLFPWTVFLPAAFAANRRHWDRNRRLLARIAVSWALVVLGFFSLSTRLEHYAFPALPALAIFVAGAFGRDGNGRAILWAFRGLALFGVLALVFGLSAGIWIAAGGGLDYEAAGQPDRLSETDFSILAEMPPSMAMNLSKPAFITLLAMACGFAIALRFEARQKRRQALWSIAAAMAVVCGMAHWSLNICEDLISSKKFGVAIARSAGPADRVVVVGDYESANSLNFYQPLPVEVVDGTAYALIPGMKFPDSPRVVLTGEEFRSAWLSSRRVFALVPESRVGELQPEGHEMMRVLDRVLVRNH
ncbi:MAG: glycosyltransferase family 39 protein [Acidobacteria bacterium]|nr:glycosyltransferase family 39 protein [Acidobacteriota bacterium]